VVNTEGVTERVLWELRALCERYDAELRNLITRCSDEGVRTEDIAAAIGISRATLWRRYGEELQRTGVDRA
jgi:CRP-like cAMP-binding protein